MAVVQEELSAALDLAAPVVGGLALMLTTRRLSPRRIAQFASDLEEAARALRTTLESMRDTRTE